MPRIILEPDRRARRRPRHHAWPFSEGEQRQAGRRGMSGSEKQIERRVESGQILVPVHEQRPERRPDIRLPSDIDERQRMNGVEHPAVMNIQARAAQDTPEPKYV
jgi:hypothetical protein